MAKQRGWSSFWQKILDWFKGSDNSSSSESPDSDNTEQSGPVVPQNSSSSSEPVIPQNSSSSSEPVVPQTTQRASFLFDGAGTRGMNVLSYNASDAWVEGIIKRQKANGDWTAWVYLSNQKDGSPNPTTIYKELFGGEVSAERVAMCRKRLLAYRNAGFKIVGWLTADDSSTISNASITLLNQFISDVHKHLGDLIDAYCVGLEMNEDARKNKAKAMIAHAKAVTKKDVGVHLTTESWSEAISWGADTLYYQAGFGKNASRVKSECAAVIKALAGRCKFVLAEYHKSSDSSEAKGIGQAAMTVPGCGGTGNGR